MNQLRNSDFPKQDFMNYILMVLPLTITPLAEQKMGKLSENVVKDCTINPHVNKINQI